MPKELIKSKILRLIKTGTAPTDTLPGGIDYGVVGGVVKLFGNLGDGNGVVDLFAALLGATGGDASIVADVAYDPDTADLTISYTDGRAPKVINIPAENFLSEAGDAVSYNEVTKILTLTLSNGAPVEIDLTDLIKTYTAKVNGGLEFTGANSSEIGIKAGGVTREHLSDEAKAVGSASINQGILLSGTTDAIEATITSNSVVAGKGIKVVGGKYAINAADINGIDEVDGVLTVTSGGGGGGTGAYATLLAGDGLYASNDRIHVKAGAGILVENDEVKLDLTNYEFIPGEV
jgi:hypothetical protein